MQSNRRVLLTIKLGLLQHLDLANIDVMQRVDGLAGLLDVFTNAVRDPGIQHVQSKQLNTELKFSSHLLRKVPSRTGMHLQFVDNFLQVVGLDLTGHDFHHLLADLTDLLVLGVGGLSDLVGALLCEPHAEKTKKVSIGCLNVHMGFNHGLNKDIWGGGGG